MCNQMSIWICVLLLGFTGCRADKDNPDQTNQASNQQDRAEPDVLFPIANGPVAISGQIKGYKAIYKTGKLRYQEPGTGSAANVIFSIAEDGSFSINLDLLYAVKAHIDLEGSYYSFFLEPDNEYEIAFEENRLVFNKNGDVNEQLKKIQTALAKKFRSEDKKARAIFREQLPVAEFKKFHDDLAQEKLQFLNEFCEENGIGDKARTLERVEIQFAPANARANYSLSEFSTGMPNPNPNLSTNDFYDVLNAYPLYAENAWVADNYLGYARNLAEILNWSESPDEELAFYTATGEFTDEELVMVMGRYQRDETILNSEAFSKFGTKENLIKADLLKTRFRVAKALKAAGQIPGSIGRDLMVSRSVAKNYFDYYSMVPKQSEWELIEQLIENPAILQQLANVPAVPRKNETVAADPQSGEDVASFEEVRKKYIDVYRGKVIYIDFWSTWCGPCRLEIPDAERLEKEFAGKEVVFLNLCVQSEKEAWENLVKQKEIGGENFLLSDSEYGQLARHYGVKGFPTYVLVDRNGTTISKNAPRPSALQEITSALNDILSK